MSQLWTSITQMSLDHLPYLRQRQWKDYSPHASMNTHTHPTLCLCPQLISDCVLQQSYCSLPSLKYYHVVKCAPPPLSPWSFSFPPTVTPLTNFCHLKHASNSVSATIPAPTIAIKRGMVLRLLDSAGHKDHLNVNDHLLLIAYSEDTLTMKPLTGPKKGLNIVIRRLIYAQAIAVLINPLSWHALQSSTTRRTTRSQEYDSAL
ncbi:hypothetical protein PSHT_04898 [Puccinia striiformis]|uniref:Uncharacterized protein n=1 Tax=Puccinia striiformis TaxID=27350 RepID=A0A2S4WBV0_9BASI|nr:hypothetical protein PSHT_04898 [Puccinia striiformis]